MAAGGAATWELSPGRRRRRWGEAEDEEEPPAVLTLCHFSRPPFLSFGRVRLGESRVRLLSIDNPDAAAADLAVDRFPPPARGFGLERRRFLVQSGEIIFISVTWTPLEEGRVRELITFVVNGIVKHQAILLGVAEQPERKQKSLGDGIRRKKPSEASITTRTRKTQSNIKRVNKTFRVSQKADKVRSPLQSCENLEIREDNVSSRNKSPLTIENNLAISPISPVLQEGNDFICTPLSMRRSTTYSVLHTAVNGEIISETDACSIKKTYNEETKSASSHNSSTESLKAHRSDNEVVLNGMLSSVCTPERSAALPILTDKRFLSPDSFINDSYQGNVDVVPEQIVPILSPEQFVRESFSAIQCVSQLHESVLPSSSSSGEVCQTKRPKWEENQEKKVIALHVARDFSNDDVLDDAYTVKSQLVNYNKPKQNHLSFPNPICSRSQRQKPKKRPVFSATVIKNKPEAKEGKVIQTGNSKSRKCLNSAIMECASVVPGHPEAEIYQYLPVIEPISGEFKDHKDEASSSSTGSASLRRKRKSEVFFGDHKAIAPECTEETETKRIFISCMDNKEQTTRRLPVSKSFTNREKLTWRKKAGSSLQKASKTNNRTTKPVVGVAQSHLTFVKPLKTVIPRHPMPFVAKNMFYDERWKEKQQRGFTWWLNFILTPDDFTVKTNISQVNAAVLVLGAENYKASVPKAPTKDEMSLRAYTARCRLNRLRRAACRLFTCEKMVKAIKKLEVEIETRRLLVRKDRHLWKDIGERQKILNWLLSYNPLWLRIGLETVYGELIALESNSDVMGLAMFILNRLLWNPDIAAEYRHPSVPHLYRNGHEAALSKFTLKKLLLLVCFLDCAKQSRIIDHDPCLFCKDAEFKTSKDILLAFARDFLSGEGDLSRHLGFLGLPVSHVQTPLDEFDFAVTNLAVDLQCGIRLVRAMELLTKNWTLSEKLRVPAISRLQKMHNVDIALHVLKERGVHLQDETGASINSRDIVDRHRERTLALLWKIVFAFQVEVSLNVEQLKEEIEFLKNAHSIKTKMAALNLSEHKGRKDSSGYPSPESYQENVKLLMDWVNAVCGFYNTKVENFTVSFSDGRVLCYLIHHYHPCYVPLQAVCQRTTQTVECTKNGTLVLNSSSESDTSLNVLDGIFDQTISTSVLYKELLDNEKSNFQLINAAVSDLGGIPAMIHHSDMSNTIPDEKVVITYLSFLCSRLLDLRKETRAARLIQSAWRKHRLKVELKLFQEKDKAARIIQRAVINFLSQRRVQKEITAAVFIQKHWRRLLAERRILQLKRTRLEKIKSESAVVIQTYWRSYSARKRYLQLRYHAILVQARIRMLIAAAAYKRLLCATITIQRRLRAFLLAKKFQQKYETLKCSTLIIQSAFRRWRKLKIQQKVKATLVLQTYFRKWQASKLAKRGRAAVVIQSWYRRNVARKHYLHVRKSVIKIQAWFRCHHAKYLYEERRAKIQTIQKYYRACRLGTIGRGKYLQRRAAIIVLQAAFRGMKARLLYRQIKAACVIQSLWRMRRERLRFLHVKQCVVLLQSHVRKYQQLKRYKSIKNAVCVIQIHCRAYIASKRACSHFWKIHLAVLVLQSAYRGMQARREAHMLRSVVKIQSSYRAYVAQKKFKCLKDAVVKIQAFVRMMQVRKRYCSVKEATLYVQRRYRSQKHVFQLQEEYRKLKQACVQIQAAARGYLIRKQIQRWKEAATMLQAYYRMKRDKQRYLMLHKATIIIQNHYRAHQERVCQRQKFLKIKAAAVCLQASYRGYRVRKMHKLQYTAAVKIQTAFRAHAARMKYHAMVQASVIIQRLYKAYKIGSKERSNFVRTRTAVLSLQAAFRGWQVRKKFRRQHAAAVKIQSAFRKFRVQKRFGLITNAALTMQQHYRARVVGRKQHQEYVELRHCVVHLQAIWRGRMVREHIQKQHQCALIIQSYYRMHVNQSKLKTWREAALVIQRHYRSHCMKKEQRMLYLKTKAAVLVLQAAYRGMRARKQLKELNKAAIIVQATYRSYVVRKKYEALRAATIVVQRWYCTVIETKYQRQEYLTLKKAVIKMQAVYRGVKVRRQIHQMHQAAISIQAMFKMHRMNIRYHAMKLAAVLIKKRYRAYCQGRMERRKYLELRESTLILQAAYRGMKVRQELRIMHQCATVIQSYYRMYRQQRNFIKLSLVTRQIQRLYRARKERDAQAHAHKMIKKSVLCIQAAFRGMKTRRHLRTMRISAVLIQGRVRSFQQRKRYISLRAAAVMVQRKYRATVLAKQQHQEFLRLRKAAIAIQSAYRGFVVRKRIQQMHRAATVIQAVIRMHKTYISYHAVRHASRIIQQHYRAYREGKCVREMYLKQYNSVIVLQAAYRGMRTRMLLKKKLNAATIIQRNYQMYKQHSYYKKVKWATKVIQKRYRANKLREAAVQRYSLMKKAATCIQKTFRNMRAVREHKKMHQAAVVIQRGFKMHRERQKYLSLKAAAVVLQRRYRALLLARRQTGEYLSLRRAVICIQSLYRGFQVRKNIWYMHLAAKTIQSAFRMYRVRIAYQNMRISAVVIQNYYRSYVEGKIQRKKYLTMQKSAVVIQAAYRGVKDRQKLKIMHASAAVIQSFYRMHRQHNYYKRVCWAVGVIQQRFRAKRAREAEVKNYTKIKQAALCLQSAFRARKARLLAKNIVAAQCIQSVLQMYIERKRFLKKRVAVVVIQSAFRCHQTRAWFRAIQGSTVVIQRWYRACRMARLLKAEYCVQRQAIITIQSAYRCMVARKLVIRIRAARKIQSFLRMAVHRRKFVKLRAAVVMLQTYYLMQKVKLQYTMYRKAALTLQNHYRSHLAMKRQREAYLHTQKSIVVIQTRIRGFNEWRRFQKIKQSTIRIQAFYRGFSQRRQYLRYKSSVVLIQQHYRTRCLRNMERQKYLQIKAAALRLQALYRGFQARQLAAKTRSARMIQTCFRGYRARKEFAAVVKAAGVIQRYRKTRQQRIWFLKMKVSAVVIQRRWRAILSARATLQQFLAVKEAAVKIQLAYRRYSTRKLIAKKQQAACLIQAAYRGFKERQKFIQQKVAALVIQKHVRARWDRRLECIKYHRTRAAIVKLQAYIRGWLVRKKILEEKQKKRLLYFTAATYHHLSAIKIQRSYRSYLVLKHAQMQISSVICIQSWFRAKLQQKQFLQDRQKIVTIQRKVRAWLNHRNEAATIIQQAVRRFLFYRHRRKLNNGIMKFQALWRGHSWRKSHDTAKTKALRHSLEIANKNSREENKLCNRTAIAIEYLLQYKHISYILAALKHLEVVTRLSPRCCEDMAQSGAIFTIFTLIRSCNRSVPCMDVIKYSIQVLLNVSKYEKTTQAVYEVESSIDTLLDLLQRYRGKAGDKISEKGGSIFTKTCCLFAILLKDSRRASEIQSKPRAVVRIQSLYKVTARKHKMEAERTLSKHKTAASVHGNYFVPVTPVRTKVVSRIKPDWVLRKDNMREIVDPLQAIRMVMDTLGVPYN
ncbi:PREDICTED: abnormal spindle-like microcephaly-associated protein [Gavialis gangeticus]|uniref:abnormal spindle-like microcephaly-associated protein n=1 Tax=Gavialis gangeticus TaxID=94835 RepID=UPI00092E2CC5|nr:PREDICTED: abnormal spindle-like microcephaly-associated protein [Gavialis gangeticus]